VDAKRVESPDFFLSQIITPKRESADSDSIYEDVPCVAANANDFNYHSIEKPVPKVKKIDLTGAQSSKNLQRPKGSKLNLVDRSEISF
jgi:hypothetical protein